MDEKIIRMKLLSNVREMLRYAENELRNSARNFSYCYERGFVYGHSSDHIEFFYNAKTKKASMRVRWYSGGPCVTTDSLIDFLGKEVEQEFFSNFVACCYDEIRNALHSTQKNWPGIKRAIAKHTDDEMQIMNFSV